MAQVRRFEALRALRPPLKAAVDGSEWWGFGSLGPSQRASCSASLHCNGHKPPLTGRTHNRESGKPELQGMRGKGDVNEQRAPEAHC
jgi:hypothetical protein